MISETTDPKPHASRLTLIGIICLVIIALYAIYSLHRGYNEIIGINDFEDTYYVAAKGAAERAPDLYERQGPTNRQNFVYPPSAAVLFYPFSFFSFETAGLIFTIFKTTALLGLMWGAIAWQRDPPSRVDHRLALITAAMLITLVPTLSDVYNGQVNIFVAFLAISGVRLVMDCRHWGWLGAVLIAVATAIKGSPLLLFAVPFLHRKYKLLAIGLAAFFIMNFALPYVWFGREKASRFLSQLPAIVNQRMIENAIERDHETGQDLQISLTDIIIFISALRLADPSDYEYDWEEMSLYEIVQTADGTERRSGSLPVPFTPETAQKIYILGALIMGLLFIAGRCRLQSKCSISWQWDASTLIVIMILLSPVPRRAQLAGLIYPVGFILSNFYHLANSLGSWRALLQRRPLLMATTVLTGLSFYLADKPGIQFPGTAMPIRPYIFVSLLGMIAILTQLLKITHGSSSPGRSESCDR